MFVHKDTNLLNKRVSLKIGPKNSTTFALIDTGASNIFLQKKWFSSLQEYIELDSVIEVQDHNGVHKTEIYNVKEPFYIDGNSLEGMQILFYPKAQFDDIHCTLILGMDYLKKYLTNIQF